MTVLPFPPRDPSSLPMGGPWEVGVLQIPDPPPDVDRVLLIVEAGSGVVRYGAPLARGASLGPALAKASLEPVHPGTPGRPSALRVRAPLLPAVSAAASVLAAPVQVVADLPRFDEVAAGFLASSAVGFPRDPRPWQPVAGRLLGSPPWDLLEDEVRFRFPGDPDLDGAVAVVIGAAGEQRGVVVYPTEEDFEAFCSLIRAGVSRAPEFTAWCLHLDPHEEFPESTVRLLRNAGLGDDEVALRVFALESLEPCPLGEDEERGLIRATEAILGLLDAHGAALQLGTTRDVVSTSSGPLTVETWIDEVELAPPLVDVDHQAITATLSIPAGAFHALVLKMGKGDTARVLRDLDGLDGVHLEPAGRGFALVGWAGSEELGVIGYYEWPAEAWAEMRADGRGLVVVAAGGAKRPSLRAKDVVHVYQVEWLELDD